MNWEWEIIQKRIEWRFVEIGEDEKKKIIGAVISIEIWDDLWDVESTCSEIGYSDTLKNIGKSEIRNIVLDRKKLIQEGVEKNRAKILKKC